jgi:hypothetical protein
MRQALVSDLSVGEIEDEELRATFQFCKAGVGDVRAAEVQQKRQIRQALVDDLSVGEMAPPSCSPSPSGSSLFSAAEVGLALIARLLDA